MPNISFLSDVGQAIYIDGNAYQKVGVSTGVPTHNTSAITSINIAGITHTNADPQGKTVYTPGERALAYYEFGTRGGVPLPGNYNDPHLKMFGVFARDPGPSDDGTQRWYTNARWFNSVTGKVFRCTGTTTDAASWVWDNPGSTLTPSSGGVIRGWGSDKCGLSVNDVGIGNTQNGRSEADSLVANLMAGDFFGGRGNLSTETLYFSFLPWTH